MVSDNFVEMAHKDLYDTLSPLANRDTYEIDNICGFTPEEYVETVEAQGFYSGANSAALVFKSWVLKWTKEDDTFHSEAGSANDEELYWRVANKFPQYLENFAMSQALDSMFTLQERIIPAQDVIDYYAISYNRTPTLAQITEATKKLIDISFALGVGDLHSGNWGYRVDDVEFKTPVIFDFSRTDFDPVEYGTSGREIMYAINLSTFGETNRRDVIEYIEAKYGELTEEQMMEGEDEGTKCDCRMCRRDRTDASTEQSEESLF